MTKLERRRGAFLGMVGLLTTACGGEQSSSASGGSGASGSRDAAAMGGAAATGGVGGASGGSAGGGAASATGGNGGTAGSAGTAGTAPPLCDTPSDACTSFACTKNVYWGDLHVHTSYSLDSYTISNRNDPQDAYSFARGNTVSISAGDANNTLTAKLERPLDFAAVTDHSEFLGVMEKCVYGDSDSCTDQQLQAYAAAGALQLQTASPGEPPSCNGPGGAAQCAAYSRSSWEKIQQAAAAANDRCNFTSLIAYEWTSMTGAANLHRNVIFASDKVPAKVFDYNHYPTPISLWQALEAGCTAAGGCDALTIPHNSNYSQGRMWETVTDPAALPYMERYQTLVEVFQHKGNSECVVGGGLDDPECKFEESFGSLFGNVLGGGLGGDPDPARVGPGMVRNAIGLGLMQLTSSGRNPLEMGFIGSTDTHNGTPGNVAEQGWVGHLGDQDDTAEKRLDNGEGMSPGGITGVWAEQNTREAIFAALKRRETFATSGPRIAVRFYALDGIDQARAAELCRDPSFPGELLRAGASPMGARATGLTSPFFFVAALKDRVDLAKLDIVRIRPGASEPELSIETVVLQGAETAAPCRYWQDPSFDSSKPSAYYARVFEQPTPRWSHYDCQAAPNAGDGECASGGKLDVQIQERAWTSPIFFRP